MGSNVPGAGEDLVSGDGYKVKRLLVRSSRQLSQRVTTAAKAGPWCPMVPCSVMRHGKTQASAVMLKFPAALFIAPEVDTEI